MMMSTEESQRIEEMAKAVNLAIKTLKDGTLPSDEENTNENEGT